MAQYARFLKDGAGRYAGASLPAVGITLGLFFIMQSFISVDYVFTEVTERREIGTIVPQERDLNIRTIRDPIKPISVAEAPPPLPSQSPIDLDTNVPTPDYTGAAPQALIFESVQAPDLTPVAIADREAVPLEPPLVTYPRRLLDAGIEGDCTVRFNIDPRGSPFDIRPNCSHTGFEREARRAVSRTRFAPQVENGRAIEQRNVVYPLMFRFKD